MGSWSFLTNHARALLCIAEKRTGKKLRRDSGTGPMPTTDRRHP
jgi:hypothetical protein